MKSILVGSCLFAAACGPSSSASQDSGVGGEADGSAQTIDAAVGPRRDAAVCSSTSSIAEEVLRPVDILWVVDTSGSMDEEADAVQSALNDFSQFIANSGIDYRVTLIADASAMSVPAPLGGSAEFLHVNQIVGSTNALEIIHGTYSQYSSFLRPNAAIHIVVVSDDESDWSHGQFDNQLAGLGNPALSDYVLHSICSEEVVIIPANPPFPALKGACQAGLGGGGAADFGETYIKMSAATGGIWKSICETNWTPIFDAVAVAVSEAIPLPCTFDIPPPPEGDVFDPAQVNFVFNPSNGGMETIPRVASAMDCGPSGGWYYNDESNPSQILVCSSTCDALAVDTEGGVEIQFGCATIVD